jgi:hypothetical protein
MTKKVYPIRLEQTTIDQIEEEAKKENRKPRNHAANIIENHFKNKTKKK